jgi:hypothetical protein
MAAVAATGHLLADAISHGKAEHKGNQRLEHGLSNLSFRRRRPSGGGAPYCEEIRFRNWLRWAFGPSHESI